MTSKVLQQIWVLHISLLKQILFFCDLSISLLLRLLRKCDNFHKKLNFLIYVELINVAILLNRLTYIMRNLLVATTFIIMFYIDIFYYISAVTSNLTICEINRHNNLFCKLYDDLVSSVKTALLLNVSISKIL